MAGRAGVVGGPGAPLTNEVFCSPYNLAVSFIGQALIGFGEGKPTYFVVLGIME
jgi:hypothetical protein